MSTHDPKSKSQESKAQKLSKKDLSKSSVNNFKSKPNKTKSTKSKQLPIGEVEQKSNKIIDRTAKPTTNRLPTKERNSDEFKSNSRAASLSSEASRVSSVLSTEESEGRISSEKPSHVLIEKLNKTSNVNITTVETPSFKPPRNFVHKEAQESPSISSLFSESNLEGKQIWYFTMPSTLDISSLESVSSSNIISEEPVIKKNGEKYIFTKDFSETQNHKIFVPVAAKNGYKVVSKPVSQILSLQQVVEETNVKRIKTDIGSSKNIASESEIKKEQPNGLKMRFHPLGFFNEPPEIVGDDSSKHISNEQADNGLKTINFSPPNSSPKNHSIR